MTDELLAELYQELGRDGKLSRSLIVKLSAYVVTAPDIQIRLAIVIALANTVSASSGGPEIRFDPDRGCYGLFARVRYKRGKLITTYGGTKHSREVSGDYVAAIGRALHMDGRYGFKLCEMGRWINESGADRKIVNVVLGRDVRALTDIEPGQQLFADYGNDYVRTY